MKTTKEVFEEVLAGVATGIVLVVILFLLLLAFHSAPAMAQCSGTFPPNSVCGNATGAQGQPKPTALGGFGGSSTPTITRAQIASTNLSAVTTVTVNGYRAASDLGYGAVYSQTGATCPNGWGAITDLVGTCFNLVFNANVQVTPGMFGAYADSGAHTISGGDVSANTQWRGTYTAGQTWDYVATQEAMYAAFANASTPGSIVWNSNSANFALNIPLYIQPGTYGISNQLTASMAGGKITFGNPKQGALWVYTGTHPAITWLCDHCSYSQFVGVSISDTAYQTYGGVLPTFSVDSTAAGNLSNALLVQQNTFYDLFINVSANAIGMEINRSTGSQGDTQTFINPVFLGNASDTGLIINSANALNETMVGGDFQGFLHNGVTISNGQISSFGSHMENQNTLGNFAPLLTQFTTYGADFNFSGQVTGSSQSVIQGFRSEASVAVAGGAGAAINFAGVDVLGLSIMSIPGINSTDINSWGASSAHQNGYVVGGSGTNQNTKNRVFMEVDSQGTVWNVISSGTSNTITDNSASYTVNQWAGFKLFLRFKSTGGYSFCTISSNTATTITFTGCTFSTQHDYMIAGLTGGTEPNWDSASTGHQVNFIATSSGFSITAGANCVDFSNATINVNDYVVIPFGDQIAPGGGFATFPMALIAKVTGTGSGACPGHGAGPTGNVTINKNAALTVSNGPGYYGTPITDNNVSWIHIPYVALWANHIVDASIGSGNVVVKGGVDQLHIFARTPWQDPVFSTTAPIAVGLDAQARAASQCQDLSAAATIDLTATVFSCNSVVLTPTSATTLNAPAPPIIGSQELLLFIRTSGTTSYAITFGTNFNSNGVLNTGSVSGVTYAVLFRSITENGVGIWQEVSRSTVSKNGAGTNTLVASPTAPNSTASFTMQGLAGTVTPVKTGNVLITISGHITSTTTAAGDGIINQISYGTGAAPTSNAALTGTQIGSQQEFLNPTTVTAADVFAPFSTSAVVTGLTPGTAYWVDFASKAVANTGHANAQVNIAVIEF